MEAFGWYKETLIFLKGNKVVLLLVTAALAGSGGITQTLRLDTAQKDKIKAVREVAIGFQAVLTEKQDKPQTRSCGNCRNLISSHIKELH